MFLQGSTTPDITLGKVVENAIIRAAADLEAEHNDGEEFPMSEGQLRRGPPKGSTKS